MSNYYFYFGSGEFCLPTPSQPTSGTSVPPTAFVPEQAGLIHNILLRSLENAPSKPDGKFFNEEETLLQELEKRGWLDNQVSAQLKKDLNSERLITFVKGVLNDPQASVKALQKKFTDGAIDLMSWKVMGPNQDIPI